MGTLVEKNLLRAMMLEVLLKDNELLKDILNSVFKEKPHVFEELVLANAPTLAGEPQVAYQASVNHTSEKTEIGDVEIRILAKRQFEKYDAVFKALA